MKSRFLPDTFTLLLVSTVVFASFLPIGGIAADYFGLATKFAIGLLFFLHGARLSRDVVVAGLLHWKLHIVILAATFVLFPLLGLTTSFLVPEILSPSLYTGIIFLCVLPSTVQSSIAFTSIAGGNVSAAICAASASNIFGMFLTPLLAGVLLTASGHAGFSLDALQSIFLQLLAPFLLGQILQPWIGNFIRSKNKILMPVDRGSILMVVYSAFSASVNQGLWQTTSLHDLGILLAIDSAILAVVLMVTMFGSRLLGFSRPDEIAITFCGSKKSLASGVPIANVLFAGQALGSIILPIMLFHQIQLIVCAVIARHYASANVRKKAVTVS
ncbi:bile acid:sodium symporter family protein [Phyllobacterium bourgognense]|uniref:Sodium/bile acid cotransporter 7 n=1 Tax=Phyllobacterium bourgognense TaxID=314236 RepID=A0A368YEK3_9HYPH|nr:bile acid:sodium symporter family protein [Phyllobacterium bourgognense]RCW78109.1 sodium/bile acid cotransporter 7 [Phyllobacterium bourgognense]